VASPLAIVPPDAVPFKTRTRPPHLRELAQAAPRHAPTHRPVRAITAMQVLGHQAAGEPGGTEDDQIQVFAHGLCMEKYIRTVYTER
jgi:hypothetical protein